jgi:hypothetical protein
MKYLVVGDIHQCIDSLLELMHKAGFDIDMTGDVPKINGPSDMRLVSLGDYVDKSDAISLKRTVEFLWENREYLHIVKGNHEVFTYKSLKGEIKGTKPEVLHFFNSIENFKADEELTNKFFDLYEMSRVFFIHPYFVCHHAPAPFNKVGKLDKGALMSQYKLRYAKSIDYDTPEQHLEAVEEELSFIKHQSINNSIPVFTGHIPTSRERIGNQYLMDGGAVEGGLLRGALVYADGYIKLLKVNGLKVENPITPPALFVPKPGADLNWNDLDKRDKNRINRMLDLKAVNWLAGTMCPADKDGDNLESLEAAFNYYQKAGSEYVVMQPKFMGSNCTIYVTKDLDKCYAVSRNGFLLDYVDLSDIFLDLHNKVRKELPDADLVVVTGELMPWSVLSRGLSDHHFLPIERGMRKELELRVDNDFYTRYQTLLDEAIEAKQDLSHMTKKDLKAKHGEAKAMWMQNALTSSKYLLNPIEEIKSIDSYKEELDAYDLVDTTPFFKPFQVLKIVSAGIEQVLPFDNSYGFRIFNTDAIKTYYPTDIKEALETFNEWSSNPEQFGTNRLEGVVIKPYFIDFEGAPYIKVRCKDYLRLVYGPTYTSEAKYPKLLANKRIGRKLKLSIEQWELGKKMLAIPYASLNTENLIMKQMMMAFLKMESQVIVLDPRL